MTIRKIMESDLMGKAIVGLFAVGALMYASDVRDTGSWTTGGQRQVYQQRADAEERARPENVAERNQLQYLIDTDENGVISSQEYDRFMEVTGRNHYLNDRLADDLGRMSPNEVESTIRAYGEAK